MFSLPPATVEGGVEHAPEGSTDDNPIVLPVDEDHFRGFLRAIYPFRLKNYSLLGMEYD